jgi:two-component system cell cycle sensor histidine kinase/response regulator CckA
MKSPFRILLIADAHERERIEQQLRAANRAATVEVASATAIDDASGDGWDVLVLDSGVSGSDLAAAVATLRARFRSASLIVASRSATIASAVAAMRAGADDVLDTGDPEQLAAALQRALNRPLTQPSEAEELFRATFEQIGVGIALGTPDGVITRVNGRFGEILQYTPEELVGRTIRDIIAPDESVMSASELERVTAGDGRHTLEHRLVRKDGSVVWTNVRIASATRPATGERYVIGVFEDVTAAREAEEKVRRSENRYRELMEQASDGIFIIGPDLRFSDVNRKATEIGQRTREELVGVHVKDVLTGLDEEPLQLDDLRQGRSVLRERNFLRKDGSIGSVEINSTLLSDGSILAIVRDITQRKEAEEKLRESEERFRLIFDATNDAMFDWNVRDRSLWMNDQMRELIGGRPSPDVDYVGWWLDHVHPADRERVLGRTLAALSGSFDLEPSEYRFLRDDGATLHLRHRTFVVTGDDGATIRVIGTITDLTGAKTAQEALVRSEDRFRALIESNQDVVAIFSGDGIPTYFSGSVAHMLGYQPEEMVGRTNVFDDVHPDDRDRVAETFRRLTEERESLHVEYRYRHRDGSWRWLEAVGKNMLDLPAVDGIVVNYRDVTERRAWQRRLDQAERLSSLGRLAATIAHEFNNVLMGIQPFAEVLRRKLGDDPRVANATTHIENSVRRGRSITQEILRFTHAAEPEISSVNTESWLGELAAEFRGLLPASIQLDIVQPAHRAVMAADRAQVTQALTNLVLNARDAMDGGGRITIAVDTPGSGSVITTNDIVDPAGFVHVTVRDEGPGIPPGMQQRIFEPLFTTKKGGTGLGLAIVHQIVTRHGGFVFVESQQGSGTTFHMLIPRARGDERTVEPEAQVQKAPSRGARVLLVEDEIAVADGLATILEMEGYSVQAVHTGSDAAAAVDSFSPDLVVLDIGLPDIDGFELYERLSDKLRNVPVIFSTGHGDATKLEQLASADLTRFLQKPYSSEVLLSMLNEVLGRSV